MRQRINRVVLVLTRLLLLCCVSCLPQTPAFGACFQDSPATRLTFNAIEPDEIVYRWTEVITGLPGAADSEKLLSSLSGQNEALWQGRLQYGSESSRSMAVVVDSRNLIWIDLDRDFQFSDQERFAAKVVESEAKSSCWQWSIEAIPEYLDAKDSSQPFNNDDQKDKVEVKKQQVAFRYWPDEDKLECLTAGAMIGTAEYLGKSVLARIEDRNSNGRWFDPADRLFVDFNNDNKLNSVLERVPAVGQIRKDGQTLLIQSSPRGRWLRIAQSSDFGTLVPSLEFLDATVRVKTLEVQLASEAGAQIQFDALQRIEVPVGNYRLDRLELEVEYEGGRQQMVFGCYNSRKNSIVVTKDEDVELNLLGELSLQGSLDLLDQNVAPKAVATVVLRTSTGLYMIDGRVDDGGGYSDNRLLVTFENQSGIIGSGSSGFT